MAEKTGLVKSPFTIEKSSDGSTWVSADFATAASWTTILTYAVPLGMAIEITPVNYLFGSYLATDASTQVTAGLTRVLKKNANGTESREIWSGANKIFKDLGDEFQRPKIRVPVVVNASQKIVVEVYSLGTTFDTASSNFYLETIQYYEEI